MHDLAVCSDSADRPVTKAKHLLFAVLDSLNELGDVVGMADALKHAQHSLVGTAMQGSIQGSHSSCI